MCCDPQVEQVINEVVDQMVANGQMFTAFEVSLSVKELCQSRGLPQLRHRDMKGDIHSALDQYLQAGAYQRNLQNVGAPESAFVYYPVGSDPSTYKPLNRHGTAPATPVKVINVTSTPAPAPVPALPGISIGAPSPTMASVVAAANGNGDGAKETDKFGRLNLPAQLVREAGFEPGDKAYVFQGLAGGKPTLVVTDNPQWDTSDPVTEYTVEPRYGIKIRPGVIERAGLGKGPYEFSGSNSYIRVCAK